QALYYSHRRAALEALKSFAASGKTPPPEVLEALKREAGPEMPDAPTWPGDAGWGAWGDRYARRAARYAWREARSRYRAPYRAWNGAVLMTALTVGFAFASQHASRDTANAFLLVAIIFGALAIGAVVSAILATVMKP